MKTAEEYLNEEYTVEGVYTKQTIKFLINKARKDALIEAIQKATIVFYNYDNEGNKINIRGMCYEVSMDGTPQSDYISVDKQSILSLINEVK